MRNTEFPSELKNQFHRNYMYKVLYTQRLFLDCNRIEANTHPVHVNV